MAYYEVVRPGTGLTVGDILTDTDIKKNHPHHIDADNLLRKGTIKPSTKKAAEGHATNDEERASGVGASGTSKIDRQDYDELTVKELRDMAKDKGITDFAKLDKGELIAALKAAN